MPRSSGIDAVPPPTKNHLLAALPAADLGRLLPHLKLVPLTLGEVLYESGIVLRHLYFPIDSIVSLLYVMADGASAEIAVVGNEGVIGAAIVHGWGDPHPVAGRGMQSARAVPIA